jgi:hypothetical protein
MRVFCFFTSIALAICLVLSPAWAQRAGGANPAKPSPTPPPPRVGLLIGVAIITRDGADSDAEQLRQSIDAYSPAYGAWVVGSKNCDLAKCDIGSAAILLRMTKASDGTYGLSAFNLSAGAVIGATSELKNLTAASLTPAVLAPLLGTPYFDGTTPTVQSGFSAEIQLVPENANPGIDPAILREMLARRGLTAEISQYTSVQVSSGSGSVCSQGQRYLTYYAQEVSEKRDVLLDTRVGTNVAGTLYDCVAQRSLSFAGEDKSWITTSAKALPEWAAVIKFMFFAKNNWGSYTGNLATASLLVDRDPTAAGITQNTGQLAAQRAIDTLCGRLAIMAKIDGGAAGAVIEDNPFYTPWAVRVTPVAHLHVEAIQPAGGAAEKVAASGVAGSASQAGSNPLNIALFSAKYPPALQCNPPGDPRDANGNLLHKLPPAVTPDQALLDRKVIHGPPRRSRS